MLKFCTQALGTFVDLVLENDPHKSTGKLTLNTCSKKTKIF